MVPRLWNETIDAHRRDVREAILATTAALVAERGLRAVTMSGIAERTGIGRATLYKYFPDIQSVLGAWHERAVSAHLGQLRELRERPGTPIGRLESVLARYALINHERLSRDHHGGELADLLHRGVPATRATQQVHDLVRDLLTDAARAGEIRDDVSPDLLADYCLNALSAASGLPTEVAVHQLVTVILAGLTRPP